MTKYEEIAELKTAFKAFSESSDVFGKILSRSSARSRSIIRAAGKV